MYIAAVVFAAIILYLIFKGFTFIGTLLGGLLITGGGATALKEMRKVDSELDDEIEDLREQAKGDAVEIARESQKEQQSLQGMSDKELKNSVVHNSLIVLVFLVGAGITLTVPTRALGSDICFTRSQVESIRIRQIRCKESKRHCVIDVTYQKDKCKAIVKALHTKTQILDKYRKRKMLVMRVVVGTLLMSSLVLGLLCIKQELQGG